MPPRFKGPTYSCVRCGRVAQVFRLSLADLRSAGYEPCRPGTYVNWCGHAQEFIPWPTAEGLFFVRADSRGSFVSRRRRRDERDMPEQLILPPAPVTPKAQRTDEVVLRGLFWRRAKAIFDRKARSPETWRAYAQSLLKVADMVWDHMEEPIKSESRPLNPESPAFTERLERVFSFGRVAAMLAGLGVEVLAKAVCVHQNHTAVLRPDGTWKLRQHKLVDLVSKTGVCLEEDERGVLTQLEGFVRWAGRYPIPLEPSSMTPEIVAGDRIALPPGTLLGSDDRFVVAGVVRKLEELFTNKKE